MEGTESGEEQRDKGVKGFFFSFFVLKVVQEVGSQCSNTEGLNGSCSPIIQRKLELDKVCVCVGTLAFTS